MARIAMVMKMPSEKRIAMRAAFLAVILPWPLMKAIMRGMLARWHGLSRMLSMPQIKAAVMAIGTDDRSA